MNILYHFWSSIFKEKPLDSTPTHCTTIVIPLSYVSARTANSGSALPANKKPPLSVVVTAFYYPYNSKKRRSKHLPVHSFTIPFSSIQRYHVCTGSRSKFLPNWICFTVPHRVAYTYTRFFFSIVAPSKNDIDIGAKVSELCDAHRPRPWRLSGTTALHRDFCVSPASCSKRRQASRSNNTRPGMLLQTWCLVVTVVN